MKPLEVTISKFLIAETSAHKNSSIWQAGKTQRGYWETGQEDDRGLQVDPLSPR